MSSQLADSALQQDPPPYTPPEGPLSIPAACVLAPPPFLRASSSSTSASRAAAPSRAHSTALSQLTPLQARRSSPNSPLSSPSRPPSTSPWRRSHTVSDPPNPRKIHARGRRTTTVGRMSAPSSSPPPYSLTPPEVLPAAPARRASSSPHLRLSLSNNPPSISPLSSQSRPAFSDYARTRRPPAGPTSDEDETSGAETDDGVMVRRSHGESLASTLRNRLLGKGKGRSFDEGWSRPITTAAGALCAGETETEGEDSVRRPSPSVMLRS